MERSFVGIDAAKDRLVHRSDIANIRGNSYRMRDHRNLLQTGADRRREWTAA